jgi:two-component system sensor histidine kinase AlgZ
MGRRKSGLSMKPSESFLPDFCSLATALVLVIASLLLAFVLTLADFSPYYGFFVDLGLRAFFIAWIVLLSGALLCWLRPALAGLSPAWEGCLAFATAQAATALVAACAENGFAGFGHILPSGQDPTAFYARVLAVSALVTAAWLRYQYVQSRWRWQARAETLARLDALQARMQPHFLFNSLNTVASLIGKDPAAAEEALLDFAEVFRAILKKDAKLVRLEEELALTRQYLSVERHRLGSRLAVAWKLEQAPLDALVPPLSLQPLVENAIRHGIERSVQGGAVEIEGRLLRKSLELTVANTLPEGEDRQARPGVGEALANLRARLEACFPDHARLEAERIDGRYRVRIVVPYQAARA